MTAFSVFDANNSWYRGNLHTHSTVSDGRLSPQDVVQLYRSRGWDFLAFTEHSRMTRFTELSTADFLVLPGVEIHADIDKPVRCHHAVGIGADTAAAPHLQTLADARSKNCAGGQEIIDSLRSHGYFPIYCHPEWSRVEWDDIRHLHGYEAMEIFNYSSFMEDNTGYSLSHWDAALRSGRRVWGVASDDCHHRQEDQCGGWVMVNAPELSAAAILQALRLGRFYASSGPSIHKLTYNQGTVEVHCSPVRAVHFVTYEERGGAVRAANGEDVTTAAFALSGKETYVRVECVAADGTTAWSNPIFFTS